MKWKPFFHVGIPNISYDFQAKETATIFAKTLSRHNTTCRLCHDPSSDESAPYLAMNGSHTQVVLNSRAATDTTPTSTIKHFKEATPQHRPQQQQLPQLGNQRSNGNVHFIHSHSPQLLTFT